VNVRLSKRAQLAIVRIHERWRAVGDHPSTFLDELLEAVEFLATVSTPGTPCPTVRRRGLKRLLLEKSRCHVYFEINERKQQVEVLTVWDGRRARAPKL
jgi:plasmid stabilization system protein ParE